MKTYKWIILVYAWVLWERFQGFSGPTPFEFWEIRHAFETKPRCEEVAQALEKGIQQERKKNAKEELENSLVKGIYRTVICLPDTVDPRRKN